MFNDNKKKNKHIQFTYNKKKTQEKNFYKVLIIQNSIIKKT